MFPGERESLLEPEGRHMSVNDECVYMGGDDG